MIDCENEVYTRIVRMLREEFPGINVAGEYTKTPSSFPHVSITQSDNSTIADKQDTSGILIILPRTRVLIVTV